MCPQKKPQSVLGKAKHAGCCLGLAVTSVFVRLRRPRASWRGRGPRGGVEIGQTSAKPGWVRTLLEHRQGKNDVDDDRERRYAFHESMSRGIGSRTAVGVILSLTLSGDTR
jgi:hypothetical protein